MVESLSDRTKQVCSGSVSPDRDNVLLITNDGRKLALEQRLMQLLLPDAENSKVVACAHNVYCTSIISPQSRNVLELLDFCSAEAQIERTKHELNSDPALHLSLQQLETISHLMPILIRWDTTFNQCTNDEKKMLMARLIDKITVDKNYRITISFRVSFDEFYGNEDQKLTGQT